MGDPRRKSAERRVPEGPSLGRALLREAFAGGAAFTLVAALGGPIALVALVTRLARGRRDGRDAPAPG